jgi:hypothetical protein
MMYATQDEIYRSLRQRLISAAGIEPSRVYLTQEPNFTEAMDYAVQITPIASGATNELNRTGLGFINERFAVTTFIRSASDNANKMTRMLAGIDRGVMFRQQEIRSALIQDTLDGLLQVAIRFVSSGPIRVEPRSGNYISSTDIFVCGYALAWPVAGKFRYGFWPSRPTWAQLSGENQYINEVKYTATATRTSSAPNWFWFAFPQTLHNMGITISTVNGEEPFYRTGFAPPSGPTVGTIESGGVTYELYRRAYETTSQILSYTIEAG